MSRFVLTAQLQLQAPNNVAQVVRQIQNQLNNVQVNVQVQGAQQAQQQIQQITRQTNNATSAAERMGRAFAVSVRRFAAFSIATRAVGLFTSTLSDAVQTAIDFERQLVKISQVTGKSVGKLRDLTNEITNLSTSLGVSSNDLLEVTTVLAQAGLSADDTKKALNSLAKAALAPNFDSISETAEGAIAILAQFGQGVEALESQLGSINAVAGAFAVEASDLIDVIRRTGGVFKSSGGDLNELLALFTSVRATTRESAESIGTGLRTIFTRIQRPKTIEYLKQFGIELVDLEGKFVGPFEAVRRLSGALAGLGEGDITFIRIAEELGGFRQIGKVLPLLQQFSVAQQALNVANKSGNSLTQDAITAQQALAIRITKVKEEFLALVRSITETSTFQIMANTALTLASALIKVADAVKPLLPLLAALTAARLVRGIGSFIGGIGGGLTSGRTFNKGGKVLAFARGGMVPGTGNRDTVPAMLQPGEFVIRKSSVNKLGASNLAAMNENRYATGGIIALNPYDKGTPDSAIRKSGQITVSDVAEKAGIPLGKGYRDRFSQAASESANKELALLAKTGKLNIDAIGLSIGDENVASQTESQIKDSFAKLINSSSGALAAKFNTRPSKQITPQDLELFGINGVIGNAFEAMLTTLGAPFDNPPQDELQKAVNKANNNSAFDYPTGLGSLGTGNLSALSNIPTDAKRTVTGKEVNEVITKKYPNLLADAAKQAMLSIKVKELSLLKPKDGGYRKEELASYGIKSTKELERLGWTSPFRGKWNPPVSRNFGGIISKFAIGGLAKAPLIDDIVNATGTMMPRPSSAIAALIKAGGGAIDIDRTLKRTLGDQAYGRAKTSGQQSAALEKYFRDPQARLNDIKSAPLTAFGRELQAAIKSGQLQPGKLSIISKSRRVPGVAEYLSQLFGIPLGNMIFTQGGSKQPAMDALRGKGPRAMRKFATGGGVGTDTVPALLTPGEFVVNKQSAQAIGYGSLNRMNKVGRYAKGGMVHRFNNGGAAPPAYSGSGPVMSGVGGNYIPFDTLSRQARNLANAQQTLTQATRQTSQAQQQQSKSVKEAVSQNKLFIASATTSLISGFLPAVDENSGAILRVTQTLLGLSTTILATGAALEAFNIQLTAKGLTDFLSGGGLSTRSLATMRGGLVDAGLSKALSTQLVTITQGLASFAGPIIGATGLFLTLNYVGQSLVEAFYNYESKIKKLTESGNVEASRKLAEESQRARSRVSSGSGAVTGAAIGTGAAVAISAATMNPFILAPLTILLSAIGAGLGSLADGLSDSAEYFGQLTATQSSLFASQKSLANASEKASKALTDFEKGNISATQLLQSTSEATASAAKLREESNKLEITSQKEIGREGDFAGLRGGLRNIFTLGGLFGESTGERQSRIDKESEKARKDANKQEEEAIRVAQPALNVLSKQVAMTGGSFDDLLDSIYRTDKDLYNILINQGTKNLKDSFENVAKEVARTKAALEAANLGLRSAEATSNAMSASMDRFAAGLEVGGNTFVANAEFLSQAVTSAGQAMNPDDIKAAVSDVSNNLLRMGVAEKFVQKFEGNTNALVQAQQNYGRAFDNIIAESKAMGKIFSADELKDKFAEQLGDMLGPDVSEEAKANLKAIIGGIELNPDEINEIMSGNYKAFGDKLTEAGQKQIEQIVKIAQERQKAEQVLINLTKIRIDAERNLVQAQQEALDLYLEGREIQAGAGGRAVSAGERRSVILGKANAQGDNAGLTGFRTGSAAELRRRNVELVTGAAAFEQRARINGGLQGASGVEAAEGQKNLQQAYKQQVDTIRSLIKLEQEELKIIQEKNKLEKESLESLIKGDIDKFFEQQAAVGATAAIATGDQNIMNQFGATALAGAFENLQRQQAAGVQESFGMQLAGAGGLVERAAGAALGARGVTDFNATRTLAGTSAEEEARKATIRELGGVLSETGQVAVDMAQMELNTASINVQKAELIVQDIEQRGREAAANMWRGGPVYASNGIFVPRGTDTVPAMLTPGEFVVNRNAVNRGNNLQVLKAINSGANSAGMSSGGKVGYYNRGGKVQYLQTGGTVGGQSVGIDPKVVSNLIDGLNNFNSNLTKNIRDLQNTKFQIKLDTTSINVNLMGGSFLSTLTTQLKKDILNEVGEKLKNYKVGEGGRLQENRGVV